MIPSVRATLRSLQFLALARGYTNIEITSNDLEHALRHAEQLATRPDDEPAALFFVLARQPGTLLDAWPTFPRVMTRNHAATVRLQLAATNDELEELAWDVCMKGLSFEAVREWFRERER